MKKALVLIIFVSVFFLASIIVISAKSCSKSSDCGVNGFVGAPICTFNKNVVQTYMNYTCINPGLGNSYCEVNSAQRLIEVCKDYCYGGKCLNYSCYKDADCNDGVYCNGQERCMEGKCYKGSAISCKDDIYCTVDSCNEETDSCNFILNNGRCSDNRFCNGEEICTNTGCKPGVSPLNCSGNDSPEISKCNNIPDNNPFTFDFRATFKSFCSEMTKTCTQVSSVPVVSTCNVATCGAQCDRFHPCEITKCMSKNKCVGRDYYYYADLINYCLSNCSCTNKECGAPSIAKNSPKCPRCFSNSDCGTSGYSGIPFCSVKNVMRTYANSTCMLSGTKDAYCSNTVKQVVIQTCPNKCASGICR